MEGTATKRSPIKADWAKLAEALIQFAQRNRRALARLGAQIRETATDEGLDLTEKGWKETVTARLQDVMPKGTLVDERLVSRCLTAYNQRQMANKLGVAPQWEAAKFDAEATYLIKLKQAELSGDDDAIAALKSGTKRGTKPVNWIARTLHAAEKLNGEQILAVLPEIAVKMSDAEIMAAIGELSAILTERQPRTDTATIAAEAVKAAVSGSHLTAVKTA